MLGDTHRKCDLAPNADELTEGAGQHKTEEWGRRNLITLLVTCLGLAVRIAFAPRLCEPWQWLWL